MTDDDLDVLMRVALRTQARTLVPDRAVRPPYPATESGRARAVPPTRRRNRARSPRFWLATGLVTATATVAVVAIVSVGVEARADHRSPLPATSGSVTAPPVPSGTSSPRPSVPSTPSTSRFPRSPVVAPGDGRSSTDADSTVAVYADCNDPANDAPAVRPTDIALACADGGEFLSDLTWTTWGADAGTGTGTLHYEVCDPDCASGSSFRTVDGVAVSVSGAAPGEGGAVVFTRLTVSPDPVSNGTYELGTRP